MHKIKIQEQVEVDGEVKNISKTYQIPYVIICPKCKATAVYTPIGKEYRFRCTRKTCDFEMSGEEYIKTEFEKE